MAVVVGGGGLSVAQEKVVIPAFRLRVNISFKDEDVDVFKYLVVLMLTFCSSIDFLKRLHSFLPSFIPAVVMICSVLPHTLTYLIYSNKHHPRISAAFGKS